MKVRFTPVARRDVEEIFNSVAAADPVTAQRIEDRIHDMARALGRFPEVGVQTEVTGLRRLPLARYPYTIFYRLNHFDDAVDVLRVIHGARVKNRGRLP